MLRDIAFVEVQTDPWISEKSIEFGNQPSQESDRDLVETLKLLQSHPQEQAKKLSII